METGVSTPGGRAGPRAPPPPVQYGSAVSAPRPADRRSPLGAPEPFAGPSAFGHADALLLAHRYADIVNRASWGELGEVVTPDVTVTLDLRTGTEKLLRGVAELSSFLAESISRFAWFQFAPMSTSALDAGPGRGRSRLFIEERRHLTIDGVVQSRTVANGVYHDTAVLTPTGWRWDSRRYASLARGEPWQLFPFPADLHDFLKPRP